MSDKLKINYCFGILDKINNNIQIDFNNEIDNISVGFLELAKIKESFTKQQVFQLFMCIYVVNVTIKELQAWSINELLQYIKQTTDFYKENYKIYYKDLVNYITN